jgi:hypothetical protein
MMLNYELLKNPYNWIIVILMLVVGSMGFWAIAKAAGVAS